MRRLQISTWMCVPLLLASCATSPNRLCFYQKNNWQYLHDQPRDAAILLAQVADSGNALPAPKSQRQLWFYAPRALYLCVQKQSMPRANDACGALGYKFDLVNGSYHFDGRTSATSC